MFLREHPNFKHIIKNRLLRPGFNLIIKNDEGLYLERGTCSTFTDSIDYAERYEGSSNGNVLFEDAKKAGAKVYIQTIAGDIEIFQKDFK